MMNLLRNIRIVFARYREYQTVLAELGSYTDRELAEIGLARPLAGGAVATDSGLAPAKA